ncbi:hypothetical protein ACFL2H_10685, partial [Planctomycetota bacterium]
MNLRKKNQTCFLFFVAVAFSCGNHVLAQSSGRGTSNGAPEPLSAAIDAATWKRVDAATDKALAWLATEQRRTGDG